MLAGVGSVGSDISKSSLTTSGLSINLLKMASEDPILLVVIEHHPKMHIEMVRGCFWFWLNGVGPSLCVYAA